MIMSNKTISSCIFDSRIQLPMSYASKIWQVWCELDGWQRWDISLLGTSALENGLSLGKDFLVIPKSSPNPIAVCVTSFIENIHFTTTAMTHFGLISFNHTLSPTTKQQFIELIHSVCICTFNDEKCPPLLLNKFKRDISVSVENIACFVKELM